MKIERHTWLCVACKTEGETITTQMTEVDEFNQILFRDHDLSSTHCHTDKLIVWVQNQRQYAWSLDRTKTSDAV